MADESLVLHQEQCDPFTTWETVRSLPLWAASVAHLSMWLSLFVALDKTVISGRRFDRLGKFVCRRVTDLLRVRVQQHGLEQLDPKASYIFCISHVSLLDLFVVFQSIPFFHRSFQDESHFRFPVYGATIRVFGQLPVSRKDKELNRRSFAQAVEMLHQGESFVVFPEGHRTRDGRLGPFYPGAFRLAQQAGVPVVPMALKGLRNICPAGDWRIRPGQVDVLFGRPIAPREGDPAEFAAETRAALNELMAQFDRGQRPTSASRSAEGTASRPSSPSRPGR